MRNPEVSSSLIVFGQLASVSHIKIIYITPYLHFQNFWTTLKFLAMPSSFTARLIPSTIPVVVGIIVVVVSGPV